MKSFIIVFILLFYASVVFTQSFPDNNPQAQHWADSIIRHLSKKEKIAQLMILRESETENGSVKFYDKEIDNYILKYNLGGICLFQGSPEQQAMFINHFQSIAKTPLMVCIDAETGLGMRMVDSVKKFPDQLTLGATNDTALVFSIGKAIGAQCKRMEINVNFAPVVDINNNPENPVINYRSFGENKYIVAALGTQMALGIQSKGVIACAKHFPGHGDVSVDSHLDLPVINKSIQQLDSLELYPFKTLFAAGVGSVMIAHLSIPAIDTTPHLPTSLSEKNVTGLLRNELGYTGLSFTDALDMKGVTKYFPEGESAVYSLIAGNDVLCLPLNVPECIRAVKKAVRDRKISWIDIEVKVKKVLIAKYNTGLAHFIPIDTNHLTKDLNIDVEALSTEAATKALTLLRLTNKNILPLQPNKRIAYVGVGTDSTNVFSSLLKEKYNADCFYFNFKKDVFAEKRLLDSLKGKYDAVVIGLHHYNKYPANNFGISNAALDLTQELQRSNNSITFIFGNPYAIKYFCDAPNIVACYEESPDFLQAAFDLLSGNILPKGKLPVSVCSTFHSGDGIMENHN